MDACPLSERQVSPGLSNGEVSQESWLWKQSLVWHKGLQALKAALETDSASWDGSPGTQYLTRASHLLGARGSQGDSGAPPAYSVCFEPGGHFFLFKEHCGQVAERPSPFPHSQLHPLHKPLLFSVLVSEEPSHFQDPRSESHKLCFQFLLLSHPTPMPPYPVLSSCQIHQCFFHRVPGLTLYLPILTSAAPASPLSPTHLHSAWLWCPLQPALSRASSLRPCFVHKSPAQGPPASLGLSCPASASACFLRVFIIPCHNLHRPDQKPTAYPIN